MRTFEYCKNCRDYREFYEVDGIELCVSCGEPIEEGDDTDIGDFINDNDNEEDDNCDAN